MRRAAMGGAVLLLLVACAKSSTSPDMRLTAAGETPDEEVCGEPNPCEVHEGVVTGVDHGEGHLVVAVDLAWSPTLRTHVGETRFALSDLTLFLPAQSGLSTLAPGEDVLVRSTPDGPQGRHALAVVRVDRD